MFCAVKFKGSSPSSPPRYQISRLSMLASHVLFSPWAFFMIDAVASQGILPEFMTGDLSFGLGYHRCHWFQSAFPDIREDKTARHGAPFGLPALTAFGLHLQP